MKLNFKFLLFLLINSSLSAQTEMGVRPFILKTNLLQTKAIQQWNLSLEKKNQKENYSNSISLYFNQFQDFNESRKQLGVAYRRVFYSEPLFKNTTIYVAPYSKLAYRSVYKKAYDGFFAIFPTYNKDFKSTSIAAGSDLGVQFNISERIVLETAIGGGAGLVLFFAYSKYRGDRIYLDGQALVQIGYRF